MGARLFNFKRLINIRLGVRRSDDCLPYRLAHEPRPSGTAAGILPDMDRILPDYYRLRKWDENGVPTAETLMPVDPHPA
jgi:aldehyde:ferredoxin oxidoreductase